MTASAGHAQHAAEWLYGNGIMKWRRVYPGRLDQVPLVRSWSAMLFADTSRSDDAQSIITELVSNALLHTCSGDPDGWFGVEITRRRQARIAVHDLGGHPAPLLATIEPTSQDQANGALFEHGHGLRVVRKLAAQMGVSGNPDNGHIVWALLTLDPSPGLSEG